MKIGFYFNSNHLGKFSFSSFQEGKTGFSGTDTRNIYLPYLLSLSREFSIAYYTTQPLNMPESIREELVSNLSEAVSFSFRDNLDFLIFNDKNNKETNDGLNRAEELGVSSIIMAGNPIDLTDAQHFAINKTVKRIVVVSRYQADILRHHPVFQKITVIPNLFDLSRFPILTEKIVKKPKQVCFLGSITPSKGFHHLAKAWPQVKEKIPDASLVVIGSAKLYDRGTRLGPLGIAEESYEVKSIIPYLGTSKSKLGDLRIQFLGLQGPKKISSIVKASQIGIVNPNVKSGSFECCSNASLEVQAFGTAIIAGFRGGLKETVLNQQSGILIKHEDQLADVIIDLLRSPEKVNQMGETGTKWVIDNFHPNKITANWIALLLKLYKGENIPLVPFNFKNGDIRIALKEILRVMGYPHLKI